jgi:DNA polymerase-4/DNA polymerase V
MNGSFDRAIVHVDGDAFFVACELTRFPALKGKPVVTGKEKGIASAVSYEAKARGITRAMRVFEMRKVCPEIIVLESDYELYALYSQRMAAILRRFTPQVEHYSIDECFADITGLEKKRGQTYETIARSMKESLEGELGITFSLGLSVNKVLAKVASKWSKPSGFTVISRDKIGEFTSQLPVGKVWGVGPSSAVKLSKQGIRTALELASTSEGVMSDMFSRPILDIRSELKGEFILPLDVSSTHEYRSMSRTRTFTPASADRGVVFTRLSRNVEDACSALRFHGLCAKRVECFLKTKEFRYVNLSLSFPSPIASAQLVLKEIWNQFDKLYEKGVLYRASGITLTDLYRGNIRTGDLFGGASSIDDFEQVNTSADRIRDKFGERSLFLASSMLGRHEKVQGKRTQHKFSLPFLGYVT